ncbi:MAG: DOMON-like domain-containing protein [Deltaproteobacteria bacterium]|nr:DOMON-like domain-containing protein [Deltaproteobacteria bacterium]
MNFRLEPFPGEEEPPGFRIAGTVRRRAGSFSIAYELAGDLSSLAIPPPAASPERRDRLWEETCLEFFLGEKDSGAYREFNLSPSGHWNAYRFAAYREGMREEEAIGSLPFRVRRERNSLRISLELDLGRIFSGSRDIDVGICAVVRTTAGGTSHWALAHSGPRPDFHRREGFRLSLSAD